MANKLPIEIKNHEIKNTNNLLSIITKSCNIRYNIKSNFNKDSGNYERICISEKKGNIFPYTIWRELPKKSSFSDDDSYYDYYRKTKKPISLTEIRDKISNYKTIGSFWDDITLMFNNCRNFNTNSNLDKDLISISYKFEKDLIDLILEKYLIKKPSLLNPNELGSRKRKNEFTNSENNENNKKKSCSDFEFTNEDIPSIETNTCDISAANILKSINQKKDLITKKSNFLKNLKLQNSELDKEILSISNEVEDLKKDFNNNKNLYKDKLKYSKQINYENSRVKSEISSITKEINSLLKSNQEEEKNIKNLQSRKKRYLQKKEIEEFEIKKLNKSLSNEEKKINLLIKKYKERRVEVNKKIDELREKQNIEKLKLKRCLAVSSSIYSNIKKINEMIKNDYTENNDYLIKNTGFKLPDKCLICHKNSTDEDFKGFAVAIPCGHVSICISCLSNKNYRNKCWINGCKKQHITYIPLKLKSLSPKKDFGCQFIGNEKKDNNFNTDNFFKK